MYIIVIKNTIKKYEPDFDDSDGFLWGGVFLFFYKLAKVILSFLSLTKPKCMPVYMSVNPVV